MTLTAGTRFGSYQINALIGVGGMGEVYRARDTKLGRDVALKLVSSVFAGDEQRFARFEREARLLASLNHTSIASIYGLEESGAQHAIVMELVDGRDVAGPLPVAEALNVARQIAEGLELAHERGIIHRDLKPANIRLTAEGAVKILDFGLAKALDTGIESAVNTQVAASPALSLAATHAGVVLGTAAYMAPEQAKGKPVDRRADIWAFGAVLYELLTGRRLFDGETVAETLASVMKEPITLAALPVETPPGIRRLLARCLDRDPRRRLQSIGEARIVIEEAIAGRDVKESPSAGEVPVVARRMAWLWSVPAAALLVAIGVLGARWLPHDAVPPVVVSHFALAPPEGVSYSEQSGVPDLAVSPDGRYVAFVAGELGQEPTLWIRALASLDAQRLDRTVGAEFPFWSPDSRQIGYFASGKLMRIAVAGGGPLTVADAPDGRGGSWFRSDDGADFIVFSPTQRQPLHRVPSTGGLATPVTTLTPNEVGHVFPQILPGGRILYSALGPQSGVVVQTLGTAERRVVLEPATMAVYVAPGFLLYVRGGALLAQRFSLDTLALEGDALAIAEGVSSNPQVGMSGFAASAGGVVYRRGTLGLIMRVRWYARDGTPGDAVLEPGDYGHLELSPDARYLAVALRTGDGTRDIWTKDLTSGAFQRLTALPENESQQAWAPDSRRVAFAGATAIRYAELGSGRNLPVPMAERFALLHSWTPDGAYLLAGRGSSVSLVPAPPVAGSPSAATTSGPQEIFDAPYSADHFRVSPDGQWIAYTSQESGRAEVMVATFPAFAKRRQVSLQGGTQPQWRADTRELFFHSLDLRMMSAEVVSGDTLEVSPPRELFRTNPLVHSALASMYAATPDGQRFLLVEPTEAATFGTGPLHVLTNWTALLDAE